MTRFKDLAANASNENEQTPESIQAQKESDDFVAGATYKRNHPESQNKDEPEPYDNKMFRMPRSLSECIDDLTMIVRRTDRSDVVRAAVKAFMDLPQEKIKKYLQDEKKK